MEKQEKKVNETKDIPSISDIDTMINKELDRIEREMSINPNWQPTKKDLLIKSIANKMADRLEGAPAEFSDQEMAYLTGMSRQAVHQGLLRTYKKVRKSPAARELSKYSIGDEMAEDFSKLSGVPVKEDYLGRKELALKIDFDKELDRIENSLSNPDYKPTKKDMQIIEVAKKLLDNEALTTAEISLITGLSRVGIDGIVKRSLGKLRKEIMKNPEYQEMLPERVNKIYEALKEYVEQTPSIMRSTGGLYEGKPLFHSKGFKIMKGVDGFNIMNPEGDIVNSADTESQAFELLGMALRDVGLFEQSDEDYHLAGRAVIAYQTKGTTEPIADFVTGWYQEQGIQGGNVDTIRQLADEILVDYSRIDEDEAVKCPKCGDTMEYDEDAYAKGDDQFKCPHCEYIQKIDEKSINEVLDDFCRLSGQKMQEARSRLTNREMMQLMETKPEDLEFFKKVSERTGISVPRLRRLAMKKEQLTNLKGVDGTPKLAAGSVIREKAKKEEIGRLNDQTIEEDSVPMQQNDTITVNGVPTQDQMAGYNGKQGVINKVEADGVTVKFQDGKEAKFMQPQYLKKMGVTVPQPSNPSPVTQANTQSNTQTNTKSTNI
jgi:DNA-directed RNA polymerase subunit M/transcription elongation factor TFIIS/DNA-directed RNA polymerase specialized sigma subunit